MNRKTYWMKASVLLSCVWIFVLFGVAILAHVLSPYDPTQISIGHALEAPSLSHWMGTDQLGRDVLSRMIYGSRISLSVGFVAVGIATALGVMIGSVSGYFGGRTDRVCMGFVDIMLCFPTFFLILACIALLDPSIMNIMAIIGLTSWMGTARMVRAEVLSLREREYVLAAKSIGAGPLRILVKHIIPNAMGPVFVTMILGVASAILIEAGLSFLGLGAQPPTASWGNILTYGKETLGVAWWLMLYPGLAILLTVLGYNLVGEAIRDTMNVRKVV